MGKPIEGDHPAFQLVDSILHRHQHRVGISALGIGPFVKCAGHEKVLIFAVEQLLRDGSQNVRKGGRFLHGQA